MTFEYLLDSQAWLILAQAAEAVDATKENQGPPPWTLFIYIGLFIGLFYFMMIRPASKARKDQEALISSVKTTDKVVTVGGIIGTVTNVKERTVMIRVADGGKLEIMKDKLAAVTKADKASKDDEAEAEQDEDDSEAEDHNNEAANGVSDDESNVPYNRSKKRGKRSRR